MEDTKLNVILSIILGILIIVAIIIGIINPNKIENTVEINNNIIENDSDIIQEKSDSKINEQEEKYISMQEGGKFCKIGNKIVFYEDVNKTIYKYDILENKIEKVLTLEYEIKKIYFDGEYIYYLPLYHSAKGIFKSDLQGKVEILNDEASLQLLITQDKIYFVKQIGYDDYNHNPQGTLCSMNKNGENVVELAQNIKNYFYLNNNKIYYTNQDREMYVINTDGTCNEKIEQGRKFVNNVTDKYLFYIDYASQEAEHIVNLETKEDNIIGYYGIIKRFQDKIYVVAKNRLDDGSLEKEYTLFEINQSGVVKELTKISGTEIQLKYVLNEKAYIYTKEMGIYSFDFTSKQTVKLENNIYFISGSVYEIDDSNIEDVKIIIKD